MANKTVPNRNQLAQSASQARDIMVKEAVEKERIATDAKTVRLKALRLAKEAEDAAAEALLPKPAAKTRKKAKKTPA